MSKIVHLPHDDSAQRATSVSTHDIGAANRARARREQLGLSRQSVARASGLNLSNLTRWERKGIPTYLLRAEVRAWERALKVNSGWLFAPAGTAEKPVPRTQSSTGTYAQAGPRARERRDSLSLSRRVVAARLGITIAVLQRWESAGVPVTIKDTQIVAWEEALRVQPGWLLGKVIVLASNTSAMVESHASDARAAMIEIGVRVAAIHCDARAKANLREERGPIYAAMFAQRYGVDAPSVGTTYGAIAKHYGLTEARLCQIIKAMSVTVQGLSIQAPVFSAIREAARAHLPCMIEDLESRILHLLGDGPTIEDVARFCQDVLRAPLFHIERRKVNGNLEKVVISPEAPESAVEVGGHDNAIASAARGMIRAVGVGHLGLIKTYGIEEGWPAEALAKVQPVLERLKGFVWLEDGPSGKRQWFTLEGYEDGRNLVLDSARRILSVCPTPIQVSDVMDAVVRLRSARAIHGIYSPLFDIHAPARVIVALLARQPWLALTGTHQSIRAVKSIDPAQTLPQAELVVCDGLREAGGVASRSALFDALVVSGRLDNASLGLVLRSAPSVARLYRGVYIIRGVQPDPDALVKTLRESAARTTARLPIEIEERTGRVSFQIVLNGTKGTNSPVVPVALFPYVQPGTLNVIPGNAQLRVALEAGGKRVLRAFTAVLRERGYQVGDTIKLSIDSRAGTASVELVRRGECEGMPRRS
ncbi:helix-turn-helix domain-containing protein [Paraburkholderia youngii]|uniref:helix-turn-helix domain-containing protein n=1 Tax=Paraburkholderia youngii TaxID=2782701 RepID=UPI003D20B411